ncbi:MAG: hypothetical protein Q8N99_08605 [Nanoarchaeota archaeon]|nr:hypothetical protein [Nanoarchaeota archaeon]
MKKRVVDYIPYMAILLSLIGILVLYNEGLTGNVIRNDTIKEYIAEELNESINNGILLKEIKAGKNYLNLSYSFDTSDYIGLGTSVLLWIADENNTEIKKLRDSFYMNKEGLIDREVSFDTKDIVPGRYNIYIALADRPDEYLTNSFFIGKQKLMGYTILDQPKYKMAGYGVFCLMIIIAVFFIVRRSIKDKDYKMYD